MKVDRSSHSDADVGRIALRAAGFVVLAAVLGNINALVDSVIHPEIPYFDEEHLIVGGVTAVSSAVLSFLLIRYERHLSSARHTIHRLEAILPICANCKKIRTSDESANIAESWEPVESYFSRKTHSEFSHGICPDCMAAVYPDYVGEPVSE
jgi:hypothetical protein